MLSLLKVILIIRKKKNIQVIEIYISQIMIPKNLKKFLILCRIIINRILILNYPKLNHLYVSDV